MKIWSLDVCVAAWLDQRCVSLIVIKCKSCAKKKRTQEQRLRTQHSPNERVCSLLAWFWFFGIVNRDLIVNANVIEYIVIEESLFRTINLISLNLPCTCGLISLYFRVRIQIGNSHVKFSYRIELVKQQTNEWMDIFVYLFIRYYGYLYSDWHALLPKRLSSMRWMADEMSTIVVVLYPTSRLPDWTVRCFFFAAEWSLLGRQQSTIG